MPLVFGFAGVAGAGDSCLISAFTWAAFDEDGLSARYFFSAVTATVFWPALWAAIASWNCAFESFGRSFANAW